ncbi:hypothetical protein [Streptomyces showdoensis]|uniref:Uncharacterized protein n=1 Tax=Streptomyces showdoensis TaxID=68268 RepID=A0A2P2GS79_STREW|nr:hypothetical protein [Streptomyces showdoensis]KKZ74347.1 hypothetical protein VO63_07830 [Streptomyces showdoensis]
MNISTSCPVSLAPAHPGWVVRNTDSDGGSLDYPIVAWAVVATGAEDGTTDTDVQPVFIADGHPWTVIDWYAANGDEHHLAVAES